MATSIISTLAGTVAYYDTLDAVNAKRKPDFQIGFWEARWMRKEICSDYRAHYPDGRLLERYRAFTIASFAAFAGALICFFTS